MLRRRLVLLYWIIAITMFIPVVAYAYIDPATTTYIIQIATAIVITLGVSLSIFLYKFRMIYENSKVYFSHLKVKLSTPKASKKGKVDVTATSGDTEETDTSSSPEKKLKYPIPVRETFPGVVKPAEVKSAGKSIAEHEKVGKIKFLTQDSRKFRQRILMSGLVAAAISFTFVIFGILDLKITNPDTFYFSTERIIPSLLLMFGICTIVIGVVLALFKGRLFDLLVSVTLALLVGFYIQGNFLNGNLESLTGDSVEWNTMVSQTITNMLIWIAIIIAIVAIRYFAKKIWKKMVIFLPSLIIVVQVVALITIASGEYTSQLVNYGGIFDNSSLEKVVTYQGMNEVSNQNNIIVFLLDRLDSDYTDAVRADDPAFFDKLDGFTNFTNYLSIYSQTFPSIPELFTAEPYIYDRPAVEYLEEAYSKDNFIKEMHENGFTTKLYIEKGYTYSDIRQLDGMADNIRTTEIEFDKKEAMSKLIKLSAYRYAPQALKPSFWMGSDEFSKFLLSKDPNAETYRTDDAYFYEKLKGSELEIVEGQDNFAFYHLNGSHTPYVTDENVNRVEQGGSDVVRQTKGAFKIVFEFIDQLKAIGLYEESTIIILGDHGYAKNRKQQYLEEPIITSLYVKPAGSFGTPLAFNNAPLSPRNTRATLARAAEGLPINPYAEQILPAPSASSDGMTPPASATQQEEPASGAPESAKYGQTYFEVPVDSDITRTQYWRVGKYSPDKPYLAMYEIVGDSNNFENWTYIRNYTMFYDIR